MKSLLESLKPSLELADRYKFRIAIENHSAALLNSADSFKAFVELASHPRLGIALAPYHLQRDKIPVEDVIAIAGPRLLFFYAWQNEPEIRQLPGGGSTDFTPWLKALAAADYRGYINPFMHESLKAAPGEDRRALSTAAMSEAIVSARRYLEQCRRSF
jgi:sugar phosphate isomerase/epimerase